MSLLGGWFGSKARRNRQPDPEVAGMTARWQALPEADLSVPLSNQCWLVVDVETTGLDMQRDRLLAIGAVIVEGSLIRLDRSFEVVIRQDAPSRTDNILIHRIPGTEQVDGVDPAVALAEFLAFAQKLPCIAFHATFDETMLRRAYDEYLGLDFAPHFVDLALLAPALVPDAPKALRNLDDWIGYFSIDIHARHRAVADAVGTAQLFQALMSRLKPGQATTAKNLFKLAHDQRWLSNISRA